MMLSTTYKIKLFIFAILFGLFANFSFAQPAPAPVLDTASDISTNTSGFNGNLSTADTDVQKALDTLDNMAAGGGSITTQEDDSTVVSSTTTIDFGSCFDVSASPATEANVSLDSSECTINADALKANGANCSAGSGAGGVTAAGVAEDCVDYYSTLGELQTAVSSDFHNLGGTDDDVPEAADYSNLTGGAGIVNSPTGTVKTDSTEADFVASGALLCGSGTQGKVKVHTTPLQYCDNAATPALQYAAYGNSSGESTAAANDSVALTTDTTGNYAAGDAEAGNATGVACTDCVALTTETSGNYVASANTATLTGLTGGSSGSEAAALSLAFDYTSTLAGNPAIAANQWIPGTTGLIFEGSTADTIEGLLTAADPTGSDKTWTLPNTTGTLITTGDSGTVTGTMIADDTVTLTTDTNGNYVASVATTSPLSGGAAGSEGAALTLTIANAAADSSTKGAASFTTNDFNSSSGNISLDYVNGQKADSSLDGFLSSADWKTFNGKQTATLTNGRIWIGNGVNVATATVMSGDATIVSSGALTIAADSVALTTDTTGNYVDNVADGTGIDGTATGEGSTYTPTLDLTEIGDHTWGDGSASTITETHSLSGSLDPVLIFSNSAIGANAALTLTAPADQIMFTVIGGGTGNTDLVQFKNSAATVIFEMDNDGDMSIGPSAVTATSVFSVVATTQKRGIFNLVHTQTGGTIAANLNNDLTLQVDINAIGINNVVELGVNPSDTNTHKVVSADFGITGSVALNDTGTTEVINFVGYDVDDGQGNAASSDAGHTINKTGMRINTFSNITGSATTNKKGLLSFETITVADDVKLLFEGTDGGAEEDTYIVYNSGDTDLEGYVDGTKVFDFDNDAADFSVPLSATTIDTGNGAVELAAGTWTATLTNTTNVAASTAYQGQYIRVGDTITGSFKVDIDPTAAGNTVLGVSLPVASNFGAAEDAAGSCAASGIAGQVAAVLGDAANDRMTVQWVAVDITNQPMYCSFSYQRI